MAIREILGLDTRPYDDGLRRAERATMAFGPRLTSVFSRIGISLSLAFGVRMVKSLADYAAELQNVDSEARKSAGAIGKFATQDDIGRVAKFGEKLESIWRTIKLIAITDLSRATQSVNKFVATLPGSDIRTRAREELIAEGQITGQERNAAFGRVGTFVGIGRGQYESFMRAQNLIKERANAIFLGELAKEDLTTREEKLRIEKRNLELQERQNARQKVMNELLKQAVDLVRLRGETEINNEEKRRGIGLNYLNEQLRRQEIINDAAQKYLDRLDRVRLSLDELAGGSGDEPNVPSGVRSKGRRVQRLERRAKEASLRGNDKEAQRLLEQADSLRSTIPGLKTSEKDFSKTSAEKLGEISDVIKKIGDKFGVAGGGATGGKK